MSGEPKDLSNDLLRQILVRLACHGPALSDVLAERARQNAKWGAQNHDPFTYLAILAEEVGEFSQEALSVRFEKKDDAISRMRTEAVQVAAVALAIVECLDRAQWQWGGT